MLPPNEDLGKEKDNSTSLYHQTPPIFTAIDCFGIVYKSLPPTQYILYIATHKPKLCIRYTLLYIFQAFWRS